MLIRPITRITFGAVAALLLSSAGAQTAGSGYPDDGSRTITAADCSTQRVGGDIAPAKIGEPVSAVTLDPPRWSEATDTVPAYCSVSGKLLPVDKAVTARPISFAIALPQHWSLRAMQLGGGGMDGSIPRLTGNASGPAGPSILQDGFATYGSDSGHTASDQQWSLNDEAIKNFSYLQLKKTHDAAMLIIERVYGVRPKYNYFVGTSQGGREGMTVAQRYPADYDGISATVPVVSFSTLLVAPALIQEQEKPLAGYIPVAKYKAIAAYIIQKCDRLDGLADGIINNYVACRAEFNMTRSAGKKDPWAGLRCPGEHEPAPEGDSTKACLTGAQIRTLEFATSNYDFKQPLGSGARSFGMWPALIDIEGLVGSPSNTPPGQPPPALKDKRFRGEEGAAEDAPLFESRGAIGVTGFMMREPSANSLDFAETGAMHARHVQVAQWIDSVNPDLSAFRAHGGKLIAAMGTNDTVASPGAQLDYFQAVINKMGRNVVDSFARFYVLPQTNHGLSGAAFPIDADGKPVPAHAIPNNFDRVTALRNWVENGVAPKLSETVTSRDGGSLPLCSYPQYPHYLQGEPSSATSYECRTPRP